MFEVSFWPMSSHLEDLLPFLGQDYRWLLDLSLYGPSTIERAIHRCAPPYKGRRGQDIKADTIYTAAAFSTLSLSLQWSPFLSVSALFDKTKDSS